MHEHNWKPHFPRMSLLQKYINRFHPHLPWSILHFFFFFFFSVLMVYRFYQFWFGSFYERGKEEGLPGLIQTSVQESSKKATLWICVAKYIPAPLIYEYIYACILNIWCFFAQGQAFAVSASRTYMVISTILVKSNLVASITNCWHNTSACTQGFARKAWMMTADPLFPTGTLSERTLASSVQRPPWQVRHCLTHSEF